MRWAKRRWIPFDYQAEIKQMWTNWEEKVDPNRKLPDSLFWDIDLKTFDFQKGKNIVVEQVIERGSFDDFYTIFRLYGGIEKVREIIKNNVGHLHPVSQSFVCAAFNINKEELHCYIRKQWREKHFRS